jgi:very-short-patch-repair endonuclease
MRGSPTPAECKLWYDFLRHSPARVRRQCPIEGYITDFYIHEHQLVIEVDGNHHLSEEARVYDAQRTAVLESLGFRIVRFTNDEVLYNFPSVCSHLQAILSLAHQVSPEPKATHTKDSYIKAPI